QDPGNMGAIMRTALAFGYEDIVVSTKCADIYSPKVLRSSMTASVKLNVCKVADIPAFVRELSSKGFSTVATCLENSKELGSEKISLPVAVLIGNEGNGLSKETIEASTHRVKIPMSEQIESLNAAVSASVMMWELRGE
ncbi:MAG: RNA methyltransferase, partial [Oscillospiraceae bacterium]|nr:RNA methyltransferase [Oscillospiraceae bacterium]